MENFSFVSLTKYKASQWKLRYRSSIKIPNENGEMTDIFGSISKKFSSKAEALAYANRIGIIEENITVIDNSPRKGLCHV